MSCPFVCPLIPDVLLNLSLIPNQLLLSPAGHVTQHLPLMINSQGVAISSQLCGLKSLVSGGTSGSATWRRWPGIGLSEGLLGWDGWWPG